MGRGFEPHGAHSEILLDAHGEKIGHKSGLLFRVVRETPLADRYSSLHASQCSSIDVSGVAETV